MISPGYLPLKADRYTPFGITLNFRGVNLAGGSLLAQVRPSPNDTGTPLASLPSTANAAIDGLRIVSSAPNTDGTPNTMVTMYITEATIKAMAAASGLTGTQLTDDDDLTFAWDFQYTDSNGFKQMIAYGPFILRAGVTQ